MYQDEQYIRQLEDVREQMKAVNEQFVAYMKSSGHNLDNLEENNMKNRKEIKEAHRKSIKDNPKIVPENPSFAYVPAMKDQVKELLEESHSIHEKSKYGDNGWKDRMHKLEEIAKDSAPSESTIDSWAKERKILEQEYISTEDYFSPEEEEQFFKARQVKAEKRKTAPEFLEEGAKTYRERNATYTNSYLVQGKVMEALFPNGVTCKSVKDHNRLTILSTMISKLIRYSVNFNKNGHPDSIHDIMVYCSLLSEIEQE